MVSDNQQIAEIDGWSGRVNKHGYWVICDPQGEDHYSEVLEIEYDSHTGEKLSTTGLTPLVTISPTTSPLRICMNWCGWQRNYVQKDQLIGRGW